jgi:hypothetical protein
MPITPKELGISDEEVRRSQEWWRAMSLNEWKTLEAKHSVLSFLRGRWKTIHEIWTEEGKP